MFCLRSAAPSVTLGKTRIENPQRFPILFELNYDDTSLLNKQAKCMVGVRITREERLVE